MKTAIATLAWIAGSDGQIYINFIGLAVFLFASRALAREAA
nr:hypothetical protein [uncultured Desulfobacter sp.]